MRLTRDLLLGTSATGAMIAGGVPVAKERDLYVEAAKAIGALGEHVPRVIGKSAALGMAYTGERL